MVIPLLSFTLIFNSTRATKSAFYLSQMMLGVSLGRYVMEDTLWLAKAEVDVSRISHENIISYSKTEYVLHYTPHNGFHEWLAEIK